MTDNILAVVLHGDVYRSGWNSIKRQTLSRRVRIIHEPELDLQYLKLLRLVDVDVSKLNSEQVLNAAIILGIAHGYRRRRSGEKYFCVWFDDVRVSDRKFLERAVDLLEMDRTRLVGLPPLMPQDQSNSSEYKDCCWRVWVCHRRFWRDVGLKELLSEGFPQLYVVQQRVLFKHNIVQLDSGWVHEH